MQLKKILDTITSRLIHPIESQKESSKPKKAITLAISILIGIGTLGTAHLVSLAYRKIRKGGASDNKEKVQKVAQDQLPSIKSDQTQKEITPQKEQETSTSQVTIPEGKDSSEFNVFLTEPPKSPSKKPSSTPPREPSGILEVNPFMLDDEEESDLSIQSVQAPSETTIEEKYTPQEKAQALIDLGMSVIVNETSENGEKKFDFPATFSKMDENLQNVDSSLEKVIQDNETLEYLFEKPHLKFLFLRYGQMNDKKKLLNFHLNHCSKKIKEKEKFLLNGARSETVGETVWDLLQLVRGEYKTMKRSLNEVLLNDEAERTLTENGSLQLVLALYAKLFKELQKDGDQIGLKDLEWDEEIQKNVTLQILKEINEENDPEIFQLVNEMKDFLEENPLTDMEKARKKGKTFLDYSLIYNSKTS